jgi:hypothetical protein
VEEFLSSLESLTKKAALTSFKKKTTSTSTALTDIFPDNTPGSSVEASNSVEASSSVEASNSVEASSRVEVNSSVETSTMNGSSQVRVFDNCNFIPSVSMKSNIFGIFDPALLDLEVAIAKNVVYFPRNE